MTAPRSLPGGLVLRPAVAADTNQIQDLLTRRGDADDARDFELMATDPDAGWDLCAVVVDGDRVVSTASLLDEQLRVGDAWLPAGQVELVATATGYEGRGLVRTLMQWAHELSTARGHLLQVMIGIPYFYRLFGYGYAIDVPPVRAGASPDPLSLEGTVLRDATLADGRAIAMLQEQAQQGFDVAMPHPPHRQRWLVQHDSSTPVVVERAGTVVGSARLQVDAGTALVAEATAADAPAAQALLAHLVALHPGATVEVVERAGTVTGRAWAGLLPPANADAAQYYVRIADPAQVLDAMRGVLFERLGDVGTDLPPEIVLSTFGRHTRLAVTADGLGPAQAGGAMQAPGAVGGAGVAPDHLGALLFGPHGMAGLARQFPDVYPGPHRAMSEALFPPLTADLLTYYLPFG